MTIEEKIKNAKELLLTYYLARGESFQIDRGTLEEHGICGARSGGLDETVRMRLMAEGILIKEQFVDNGLPALVDDPALQFSYTINGAKLQIGTNPKAETVDENKNYPNSLYLVTTSLNPIDVVFLVFDENFNWPIRCAVKNNKGEDAYIRKLYDIAYLVNAPGKMVRYDKGLADCINNGLFKRRPVAKYMRTNHLEKPTLVQKSEDKKTLVLKNQIPIKTLLVHQDVPPQYQSLYIDKTS